MLVLWHVGFAVLAVVTAALAAFEDGPGTGRRVAFLAGLTALSVWYGTLGARALARESAGLGLVYLAVAGPVVITLFALRPVGALMLFVLYPHIWMTLPFRHAVAGTVAAILAVAAVMLGRSGIHPDGLLEAFVPAVVALLVALLLGTWITKIIKQSELRAGLLTELSATRAELAAVSRDAGVTAERERLAREIHDTLAQGFTSILILLDAACSELPPERVAARRHLELARRSARENLAEARALIAMAPPVPLERASLPNALARLVERVGRETGVRARHQISGRLFPLPTGHEVVLFRVLQEALANVGKHARAAAVDVCLCYDGGRVTLDVEDDGCGFDEVSRQGTGVGLAGMRRRVEQLGGTFHIRSSPGAGTAVQAELPAAVTD